MKITDAIAAAKTDGERAIGAILSVIGGCSAGAREIIEQDLDQKEMGLEACFKALQEHARKNQTGGCWACPVMEVTPENEAVRVIADFYKIPNDWAGSPQSASPAASRLSRGEGRKRATHVDLMELI